MNEKLTTQAYWEKYYAGNKRDRKHIINVCSYYDRFWYQFVESDHKGKSLIEIGGYPGRYLAYLGDKFELFPTCLDFNSDRYLVEESFKSMGVHNYELIISDFTKYKPESKYDYVLSNGFIEHFENFDEILDKHLEFLKPGGKLMIMIPNKRYLRKYYGVLCDYENLKAHNLKCMDLKVFKTFAQRNELKIQTLQYYGGFPYTVHQKLNKIQNLIYKVTRRIFKYWINPHLMKRPSKYFSENIVAIFETTK